MFGRKKTHGAEVKPYDMEEYKAVLKCSICNGEQVAGFKNRKTGKFEEVAFIRSEKELKAFLTAYGLEGIEKEY